MDDEVQILKLIRRFGYLNLGKDATVSLEIEEIQELILRVMDELLKDC